jgi:hypothetical protein
MSTIPEPDPQLSEVPASPPEATPQEPASVYPEAIPQRPLAISGSSPQDTGENTPLCDSTPPASPTVGLQPDPTISPALPQEKATAGKRTQGSLEKWVQNSLCVPALWVPLFTFSILRVAGIGPALPWWGWVLMASAAIPLIVHGVRRDESSLFQYLFHLLLGPYLLALRIGFWIGRRYFAMLRSVWQIARWPFTATGAAIHFVILPLLTMALLSVGSPFFCRFLAVMVVIVVEFLLIVAVRLAANPLRPFAILLEKAQSYQDRIESGRGEAWSQLAKTFDPAKLRFFWGLALVGGGGLIDLLLDAIDNLVRKFIIPLFSCLLVAAFLLVVTEYGAAYYALQQMDENTFEHLGRSFPACWCYSLTVLTTGPISNVNPQSGLAWFIYTAELSCTFLLISVFFAMFSTALGYNAERGQARIKELAGQIRMYILQQLDFFLDPMSSGLFEQTAKTASQQEQDILQRAHSLRDSLMARQESFAGDVSWPGSPDA